MRIKSLIFLLLGFQVLFGINSFRATGDDVSSQQREDEIYFHNNQHDLDWYGSDRWAVLYDFDTFYDSIDTLFVRVDGVKIYLPEIVSNIDIKFWDQPENTDVAESLLASVSLPVSSQVIGWNEIDLPTPITEDTLWMVVEFPTYDGQEIASSAIDGTHSYYYEDGIFKNMAANGFSSEFLFSLYGEIQWEFTTDLAISNLEMINLGDTLYYPQFTLKNNSNLSQSEINLNYTCIAPAESEFSKIIDYDLILDPALASGEEREIVLIAVQDSLLEVASMYQVSVSIENANDEFSENNLAEFQFDTFNKTNTSHFVENFISLDNYGSNQIWDYQIAHPDATSPVQITNYFVYSPDYPYYVNSAMERYHHYNLGGIPASIFNGVNRFIGYNNSHDEIYADFVSNEKPDNFISLGEIIGTKDVNNGSIELSLTLINDSTYVFAEYLAATEINFIIVENLPNEANIFGDIFRADIESIPITNLTFGRSETYTTSFNTYSLIEPLTGENDFSNCKIIYWVQNPNDNKIFTSGEIDFNSFGEVGTSDAEIAHIPAISYLNPSNCRENLQITLEAQRSIESPQIYIYNIKGQKIAQLDNNIQRDGEYIFSWNGRDTSGRFTASGVYLMQVIDKADGKAIMNKKLLRLRD